MNEVFFNRKPNIIDEDTSRRFAVLVPIVMTETGPCILFEKRSSQLKRQPGEICFPGGKIEKQESPMEAAIRETCEELKITKNQIKILGPGDLYISPFNTITYPYLGVIQDYQDSFSTDEVETIYKVPVAVLMHQQPEAHYGKLINHLPIDFPFDYVPQGKNYPWSKGNYEILFYRYEDLIIWGFTAKILKSMLGLFKAYQLFENLS